MLIKTKKEVSTCNFNVLNGMYNGKMSSTFDASYFGVLLLSHRTIGGFCLKNQMARAIIYELTKDTHGKKIKNKTH